MSKAIDDIAAERLRQIGQEDWSTEHDDGHKAGDLAMAGIAYASHAAVGLQVAGHNPGAYQASQPPGYWSWSRDWWKPKNPRRDLVRAGALIVAEIERLDRAAEGKEK